ncbi:MAG: DnaB-like helicase C-terminal domain-containing protein, partial [Verrucomicrobiales bacterium]
ILTELSGLSQEVKHETTVEVFERSIEHFDAWSKGDEGKIDRSREIVWGIPVLDEKLGGWNPVMSDFLVLLGGDSSWGKSSLARQVAVNNCYRGKRVANFLLETSTFSWPAQAAAQRAQVNLRQDPLELAAVAKGEEKLEKFRAEMRRYREWAAEERLFVDETAVTAEQVAARSRMIAARTGSLDLIVVDYLQEMRSPDRKLRGDQALHENCRELKALGKELRCPVLLLSSINTDYPKDYGPGKWDYRGSRDITYAADQAFQIFRPEKDANGVEQTELTASGEPRKSFQQLVNRVKGRDAGTGAAWVTFQPRFTLWWGLPPSGKRGRKSHDPEYAGAQEF